MSEDCVFCRIVAGTLPSYAVCEDELALAFMDIHPVHPGHALVIAKEHAENVFDVSPRALAAVAAMAQRVAKAVNTLIRPDGINLLQANGPGAAQSVPHFHVHVLPRRIEDGLAMNWMLAPGNHDEIRAVAEKLKRLLAT